jgi:hypothetical protein
VNLTPEQIAALDAAEVTLLLNEAKGVQSLKMGEEQVVFRTIKENDRIRANIRNAKGGAPNRSHYPAFVARPE